VDNLENQIPKW